MRLLRFLSIAPLTLVALQTVSAMNNADLIKMKKADLSEETIILAVQKESADYDTSSEGLIELKKAGLSEAVIQKVMARSSGSASPAAAAASPAAPVTPAPVQSELFSVESPSIAPPLIQPVIGQDYFTRYTFFQEKGEYPITGYTRGTVVPINTPVKLISMSGKKILLKRLDTNEEIKVDNIQDYSKRSNPEVAQIMLSAEKTPIEKLVPTLTSAIRSGELRKGMTKEQVIMTRGYPPAHETPSIDGDKWVYWSSRFVKLTILFSNGRLTEGRGLY